MDDALDILVSDHGIRQSFTDREGGSEAVRRMQDHLHGHKAAVGTAADIDPVLIDSRMGFHKVRDQFVKCVYINGVTGEGDLAAAVIHPISRRLGSQQECAAEILLHFRGDQVDYFVAGGGDYRFRTAFSGAVQPDDQRIFLFVGSFRFIIDIGKRGVGMCKRTCL